MFGYHVTDYNLVHLFLCILLTNIDVTVKRESKCNQHFSLTIMIKRHRGVYHGSVVQLQACLNHCGGMSFAYETQHVFLVCGVRSFFLEYRMYLGFGLQN